MTASAPGVAAPDREALARDGVRLWYRLIPAPSGTPLVLSNGAACSVHYWPLLVERFAGRLPIVLWDYRSHGRSQRAPLDTISIETFADDLVAVLDAAEIERATLCGHSMGVQVILEAYRRSSGRVAGLVPMFGTFGDAVSSISRLPAVHALIDSALRRLEERADEVAPFVLPLLPTPAGVYLGRLIGSNLDLCPPGYVRALMEHIRGMDPRTIVRVFRSVARHSAWEVLPRVDVPALIFAGALDRMTPPALARRMAAAIPDAEIAVVEKGSHLAMLEDPDFVHARLAEFLRKIDSRG